MDMERGVGGGGRLEHLAKNISYLMQGSSILKAKTDSFYDIVIDI